MLHMKGERSTSTIYLFLTWIFSLYFIFNAIFNPVTIVTNCYCDESFQDNSSENYPVLYKHKMVRLRWETKHKEVNNKIGRTNVDDCS